MSGPEFIYNNLSKPSLNNSNIEKIESIDNVEKIDKFETNSQSNFNKNENMIDKVEKIEEPPKPLYQEKQELNNNNNVNSNSQHFSQNSEMIKKYENDIPALNPQSFYQNSEDKNFDKKMLKETENKPVSNIEAKKIAKDKIFKREPMFRLFKKSAVVLQ